MTNKPPAVDTATKQLREHCDFLTVRVRDLECEVRSLTYRLSVAEQCAAILEGALRSGRLDHRVAKTYVANWQALREREQ